jgi:hypothetical protein
LISLPPVGPNNKEEGEVDKIFFSDDLYKGVITCAIKAAVRKSILIQITRAKAATGFH